MEDYTELHLNKESLDAYTLPDIGFPVPVSQVETLDQSGGKIDLKALLFWLQEYSAVQADKWLDLETAIFRLALLLAPEDKRRQIRVYGDNWFLICGALDLNQNIMWLLTIFSLEQVHGTNTRLVIEEEVHVPRTVG